MEEEDYKGIAKFFVTVIFTIPLVIFKGYILSRFWYWFIVPLFDVPLLDVTTAIGLSMTVSLFTLQLPKENEYDKKDTYWLTKPITYAVLYLLIWFIGWIVSLFL